VWSTERYEVVLWVQILFGGAVDANALPGLLSLGLLLSSCAPGTTGATLRPLPVDVQAGADVRGHRYCEVLPVYLRGLSLQAEVFNTLGLNECPAGAWDALTADDLRRQTGAVAVQLNGPRAWAMDVIQGRDATVAGKQATFGTLAMVQRATVPVDPGQLRSGGITPYAEQRVDRDTTYVYRAGRPTYRLVSPVGRVYVMQTYDLKTSADAAALEGLGARLHLPAGWAYRQVILAAELRLEVRGQATVLRDDLGNTYQAMPDLQGPGGSP